MDETCYKTKYKKLQRCLSSNFAGYFTIMTPISILWMIPASSSHSGPILSPDILYFIIFLYSTLGFILFYTIYRNYLSPYFKYSIILGLIHVTTISFTAACAILKIGLWAS